ncbi:AcrR family transcriptional regulator [Methanococcus maripaludis]|uniref:AcrR family transcriptional regulator n=1 Tax=Methanococcus maripaludis TaxID=39152 RepID=A0A7J9P2U7_METMI|nr:TetR/AcrR family transcriptional regulator [Methanococcus maripaludis]MBA2853897.1 AcrR family transcriptional regulator [Methanococcus maripaludis]MBA2868739.1 AcrR family transcriptional regulator [Methanococcus maripaludis]
MDTRDQIIKNSRDIFFKKGYNETSLLEIAKKCNISKGGLYHYFNKKEDLFLEVIVSMIKENEKIILSCIEKDMGFEEAFFEFIDKMIMIRSRYFNEYIQKDDTPTYSGPLSDAIKRFPEIWEVNNNIYENIINGLVNRIIIGQENGEIKENLDPHAIALHFCSIYEGLPLVSYYTNKKFDETARTLFNSFWDIIKN